MHLHISIKHETGALPPTLLAPFNSTPRLVTIFILVILFVLFRYSGNSEEYVLPQDGANAGNREITGGSILGSDSYIENSYLENKESGSAGLNHAEAMNSTGKEADSIRLQNSPGAVRGRGEKRPTLDFLIPEKEGSKNAKPKDESPLLEIEKKLGLR